MARKPKRAPSQPKLQAWPLEPTTAAEEPSELPPWWQLCLVNASFQERLEWTAWWLDQWRMQNPGHHPTTADDQGLCGVENVAAWRRHLLELAVTVKNRGLNDRAILRLCDEEGAAAESIPEALLAMVELAMALKTDAQTQTMPAAGHAGPTAADRPDSRADKGKKSLPIPKNLNVLKLAQKLKAELNVGESKRSLAIQFTDGNETQADSLLRQLRRYPHLIKH
jgi:hypothetical protein